MVAAFGWAKAFMPNGPNAAPWPWLGSKGAVPCLFLGTQYIYILIYNHLFMCLLIVYIFIYIIYICLLFIYNHLYIYLVVFLCVYLSIVYFLYIMILFFICQKTPRCSVL